MDALTPSGLLTLLQVHGYVLLFLIMIFEGSIATFAAAFLASTGFFNVYLVLALSILGNVIGDTIFYYSGRHLGKKYVTEHFHKIKEKKLGKIIVLAKENPAAALAIIKNSPVIPIPGLMLIGASGIKPKPFYIHSTYLSIIRSGLFVLLGFFSGEAFQAIAARVEQLEIVIAAAVILGVIFWIGIKFILKKFVRKVEEAEEL